MDPGCLLGREQEIAEVLAALEVSRLVTLTGEPGIGKTRLALAVATGDREHAVVELAAVTDPALVPTGLTSALRVRERPGQSLTQALVASMRNRRMLLVLDNCEHLLRACAGVVAELLAACSEVRVLATSREPLLLDGERVWKVPPLPVPDRSEGDRPEGLIEYPAVALFVQRAREVQPGFALSAFVASDAAEICRRLEGVPLAIELAAARVGLFTPGEIAARLEDRLSLLSSDGDARPPRHRTFEAALDWSHALLCAAEQVLLRRLSVFAGRFDLEAAEAVCAGGAAERSAIARLLSQLASRSLLAADAGAGGQLRYRLLETIRAYAAAKLEHAGEATDLRAAHARFYLLMAERNEVELTGPRQLHSFELLDAERSNLRAATEWSLCHGETEMALRLAGALVLFWRVRSRYSEGRSLLEAALAASNDEASVPRAKALWGVGFMAMMAGDRRGAIPALEESLAYFRQLDDLQGCARALLVLANARQGTGDRTVVALLEESASLARQAGDRWCLAHALGLAAGELGWTGDPRRARDLLEECIEVARDAADMQSLRIGLLVLGDVAVAQGDYAHAEPLLEEAVQVTEALGEDYGKAIARRYLGMLALGRGDWSRARALFDESVALLQEYDEPGFRLDGLLLLANAAHAQGDTGQARRLLDEARARGHGIGLLQALGQLAVEEGDLGEARRRFEEVLDQARAACMPSIIAKALHWLGHLARVEGAHARAADLHREALELQRQIGELPAIATSLEALAGLEAAGRQARRAAWLLGAADALRERGGYARTSWEAARYAESTALVRESLPAEDLDTAVAQGRALSLEQALAEATKGPGQPDPVNGKHSLTKREQEVLELVAERLTNPEIAERLVISLQTVKTHVSHILDKLGVEGRRELARDFRSRNGGPP